MKANALLPLACLVLLGTLIACGGGGGGGGGTTATTGTTSTSTNTTGRPPVAPEPICNSIEPAPRLDAQNVGGGNPNFIIPETSIPRAGEEELRAHTNFIIRKPNPTRGLVIEGLTPSQVRGAYGNTGTGSGAIAVVVAYNYPTALNDFNVFSSTFALPTEPSTNATLASNTVFQVVYASGSKPADNAGWSQEAALDIEWSHAMAPNAKIYLVEAKSDLVSDLMDAVNVAKSLPGVRQVSMSFSAADTACNYVRYNPRFQENGVSFFAAAGDTAGERAFPALSYHVVAVGGTTLAVSPTGQWLGESVWESTGCGPSAHEPRPVFQDPLYPKIPTTRAGSDIAAVGDPNTGVAVYCSVLFAGDNGWLVFGGTSASCPIIAGCVNAAETAAASSQALNTLLYAGRGGPHLHDITVGSSAGFNASVGWDYPSGVGTPKNLAALIGPA